MARLTGLEPATPGVTGRYSNQLSYNRAYVRPALPNVRVLIGTPRAAVKRIPRPKPCKMNAVCQSPLNCWISLLARG